MWRGACRSRVAATIGQRLDRTAAERFLRARGVVVCLRARLVPIRGAVCSESDSERKGGLAHVRAGPPLADLADRGSVGARARSYLTSTLPPASSSSALSLS